MEEKDLTGIINVYKEKSWTSFDVVAKIRGVLRIKKIGHTGTLDPQAEGVLPICLNKATKVVDLITDKTKVYQTTCRLGISTDTQDHTGSIIEEKEVKVTEEAVREALMTFVGEIFQIPPMYSALKVNGQKLYHLAREGITVEREARKVVVYDICNIDIALPYVSFQVTCSKGTYIRTICHDLGAHLSVGGHMTELIRTQVGSFNIENSIKIDELVALAGSHQLSKYILPIDQVFEHLTALNIDKAYDKWLYSGNKIPLQYVLNRNHLAEKEYKVYDEENHFIGIYKVITIDNNIQLKPLKLFI